MLYHNDCYNNCVNISESFLKITQHLLGLLLVNIKIYNEKNLVDVESNNIVINLR